MPTATAVLLSEFFCTLCACAAICPQGCRCSCHGRIWQKRVCGQVERCGYRMVRGGFEGADQSSAKRHHSAQGTCASLLIPQNDSSHIMTVSFNKIFFDLYAEWHFPSLLSSFGHRMHQQETHSPGTVLFWPLCAHRKGDCVRLRLLQAHTLT